MNARNCFSAAVFSGDMHPRMRRGESVLFTDDHAASAGDDVLIAFDDGSYVIRELVEMSDRSVIVRTYSPDAASEIPIVRIRHVFPIIGRVMNSVDGCAGDDPLWQRWQGPRGAP